MLFRIPADIYRYKHFALVTERIDLTTIGQVEYNNKIEETEIITNVSAGIYGFQNKANRDRFVSRCNRGNLNPDEVAFHIDIVVDQKQQYQDEMVHPD